MNPFMETRKYTMEETERLSSMLRKGGLVAVPTETVYGIAASAEDGVAVQMIYDLKDRDYDKPVSVLVTGMDMVEKYCQNIPPVAYRLAEKYWPGPLTMILEDKEVVPAMVTADTGTLGVRCPDHPLTAAVIQAAGGPLAAPSANPASMPPPTTAKGVLQYFDGRIEGVLDGGPCAVGVASTIVDLTGEEPRILREGGIPGEEVLTLLREME